MPDDPMAMPCVPSLPSDVTRVMNAVGQDRARAEDLLPLVYAQLRQLAAARLAHEPPGQTLQATALVHEAWLRLRDSQPGGWNGQRHFFGAAAQAIRRILVERARQKRSVKRGGDWQRVNLDNLEIAGPVPDGDLLALDEALTRLGKDHPKAANLVQLCFFAGLTQAEAAQQLGVSVATAERTWAFARTWLFREVKKSRQS